MLLLVKIPVALFTGVIYLIVSAGIVVVGGAMFLVSLVLVVLFSPLLAASKGNLTSAGNFLSNIINGTGDMIGTLWSRWSEFLSS
ncbi:hypothetical protein [Micromonospora sp. NBC_01796]|uniref:hypothetical protein n=1 Tax=Micromonospora sp. NBC_01796 TaxID=2975987 RepID=UPI002DDBFCA1|nr:hypothetical protein [Micromonospora sp. NBC_01796]WSA83105.1 hypothetical protein OIE47_22105 [Micromonospora sp. NBC_01796]